MKKIYFLFAMMLCSLVFGQIVNFPDANFKNFLLNTDANSAVLINYSPNGIDANNDGEIQISEAANVTELRMINTFSPQPNNYMNLINSLEGIKSFVNLQTLYATGFYSVQSIDLSNMPNLYEARIEDNSNSLASLNLQNCPALSIVKVSSNKLNNLLLHNSPLITEIDCSSNLLQSLDVSDCTALFKINGSENQLNLFNLNNLVALNYVDLSFNNLTSISFNNNSSLQFLELGFNNLQNLATSQIPNLKYLMLINNNFAHLNFADLLNLQSAQLSLNNFTSIDFSQNNVLNSFSCVNCNNLEYINIKNGSDSFAQSPPNFNNFSNTPNLQYICCDSNEVSLVTNLLAGNNQTNVVINSYCSFTPGGTFYTIQGETKYDVNNNGCDPADPKKALQKFTISGANGTGSVIGNTTGQYSLPVQAGSHIITPILENPAYFNISPANFTANFPTMTSPLSQNYCLTANGNHNDLEIAIIPVNAARPGFVSEYKVLFKNKGTATQAGNFSFNYNDNVMNFLSTSLATSSQSFGVLNYNFTNLLPFQTRELTVKFTLNTPTATPPLVAGQILNYTAQINGATDETPLDNTFTLNQTVVNSFDPNDKTCLEGAIIAQAKVGDYVHYLIRFENTGTANAQNIVVKDMIDTAKFDINTLVALNGSDSFVTRITNPNTVEFIFENIQLPFADLYNDGYVSFKIKTKSTLVLGDSFSNTANIYFDYNAPIVTNTAVTTIAQILGTQENAQEKSLSFFPNPVEDVIHFKTEKKLLKAEIYDAAGRIVSSVNIQNNEANLGFLKTGNYLVKTFTKDQFFTHKITKK